MLLKELVRDSFVPDGNLQRHRQYGFQINEINKDLVRCEQRINMILQRCNIRLSNYVSRTKNKSYRKVVDALVAGETSADVLVKLLHGRTANWHEKSVLHDALEGFISENDRDLLRQYTQSFDMLQI
ncbi:hypothetical protein [Tannerella forsythia]|uniref:Uncharacterized protein n=1 Tax=Tannerella forsythia TaxID=28112 RepID=A0A3P1XT76_TANFO|nr:hypothetical protein [Tannerella forsythia]RRD61969.1 hypothetical protein EII40_05680 [Tannerella forsythia]